MTHDIGFENSDSSLKRFKVRIDGNLVGPELTYQHAGVVSAWIRSIVSGRSLKDSMPEWLVVAIGIDN